MPDLKTLEEKNWSVKDFNYPVPAHAKSFGYSVGGITVVGFMLLIFRCHYGPFFHSYSR